MTDEECMAEALKEARIALADGEIPVGAVVVYGGAVIGRGHNRREEKKDVSSHAEIEALKDAARSRGSWKLDGATLFVTLEPCLMCASAIAQSHVFRVVYGCEDPQEGAISSHHFLFDDPAVKNRPLLSRGINKEECASVLRDFFGDKRK